MQDSAPDPDLRPEMDYTDYLRLDRVLDAQVPLSDAPDELLFIIQHQASELWMKLVLHELTAARDAISQDRLPEAFKGISRCARIFEQLNGAWDVLRTMTPSDYTTFREALGQSSGFQSVQYRLIEFVLGNRDPSKVELHRDRPSDSARLGRELRAPSLYDAALACAHRQGLDVPATVLSRDRTQPHGVDERIISVWAEVYRDPATYWNLYELAEKLVDLEDYFRRWRFNHVTTVERVIGLKQGTGGSAGVGYLKKMMEVELFPDLWRVRTEL
ncbi:MAG: tryptophan 2,3-dioxygenase family protein [Pseudomonadota bacterium]